ncbi:MAG TPA: GvpL/GvpF family gas vesicle protein [Longimicrobiales bacterium]
MEKSDPTRAAHPGDAPDVVAGGGGAGGAGEMRGSVTTTAPSGLDAREDGAAGAGAGGASGLYLYGVVRGVGRRAGQFVRGLGAGFLRVPYRDLVAIGRAAAYDVPALETPELLAHQRTVESIMRRGTILPAPPGVVFRGRRPLLRFLEDQYLALEEGLSFLEGHWELRLHIAAAEPNGEGGELERSAMQTYAELRRYARAAVPFPRRERFLLSAAFLVDRTGWIEFVERAEDLGAAHAGLALDVTGPWPPYDFVRLVF